MPRATSALHERFEERRADPAPLLVVHDHERDFGDPDVVGEVVLAEADETTVDLGGEHAVRRVVGGRAGQADGRFDRHR